MTILSIFKPSVTISLKTEIHALTLLVDTLKCNFMNEQDTAVAAKYKSTFFTNFSLRAVEQDENVFAAALTIACCQTLNQIFMHICHGTVTLLHLRLRPTTAAARCSGVEISTTGGRHALGSRWMVVHKFCGRQYPVRTTKFELNWGHFLSDFFFACFWILSLMVH